MLKILQARLQQYVNPENFQMFKLVLEKAEEREIKLPTSAGSWEKEESSRKISLSCCLSLPLPPPQFLSVFFSFSPASCGKQEQTMEPVSPAQHFFTLHLPQPCPPPCLPSPSSLAVSKGYSQMWRPRLRGTQAMFIAFSSRSAGWVL